MDPARFSVEITRALAVATAWLLLACGAPSEAPPTKAAHAPSVEGEPIEVETARVVSRVLATTVAAAGSVRARRESSIGAEVSGRIVSVLVDVGDEVAEGDELFRIDPVPFEVALSESRAELALARAEFENARAEEARAELLFRKRTLSTRGRDERKTAAAMAAARVDQMEARLVRARTDLERTVARAPYAGSIVERLANEGELAGPRSIVVLQESGSLEVVLDIPEATLVPVRVGDAVRIFAPGLAQPIESAVTRVSDRVDDATRTVEVRAPVTDHAGILKAGSFVRAQVVVEPDSPRPVVPIAALLLRDGLAYVFVVQDDAVQRVAVRTGGRTDEAVELLSGVSVGVEVVRSDIVSRLVDGDRIRRVHSPVASSRREVTP
jgi:HlyD family secretion protein